MKEEFWKFTQYNSISQEDKTKMASNAITLTTKGTFVPFNSPLIDKTFSILDSYNLKMTWLKNNSIFQEEDSREENSLSPKARFEPGHKFGIKGKSGSIKKFCKKFKLP